MEYKDYIKQRETFKVGENLYKCPICGEEKSKMAFIQHVGRAHFGMTSGGYNGHYHKQEYRDKIAKGDNLCLNEKLGEMTEFEVICHTCKTKFIIREREKQFPKKERYFCCRSCANVFSSAFGKQFAKEFYLKERRDKEEKYYLNPNHCPSCNKVLSYLHRKNKFCSHQCAGTFNFYQDREATTLHECYNCEKKIQSSKKFCSIKCLKEFKQNTFIRKWINGDIDGKSGEEVSHRIRKWLLTKGGHKCSICGIEKWNGSDVPIVLDHIDGDSTNNRPDNLRIICRNCDGLLPTFAGRNKGKGRKGRRERIRKERSLIMQDLKT